jgi:hypothetical protein
MSAAKPRILPELSEYEKNRQQFTVEQLAPYEGQWVAFSLDGKRIVAAAPDLLRLDEQLRAIGESIGNVGLECIVFDDFQGGQAEIV